MSDLPAPSGTIGDRLSNSAFRGMLSVMNRLPYERRIATMGRLMSGALAPALGWQRRAMKQIAWIHPDWPRDKVASVAKGAADNAGRTLMELYAPQDFPARMADAPLHGEGLAQIDKARSEGRPVLFVTGHFGNHEAPRHALLARGYVIGGLYRPMKNPYFNAHYARTMTDYGGPVFAQGRRGTAGFARHLAEGGMATLLFDVWYGEGPLIPFLGKPAPTSLAAAELARRSDALMVPYFATRRADGVSFDIVIEKPLTPAPAIEMMQAATSRLEAHVNTHPEQWFWTHRRWKPERQNAEGTP